MTADDHHDDYMTVPLASMPAHASTDDLHQAQLDAINEQVHGQAGQAKFENPLGTTKFTPWLCLVTLALCMGLIFFPLALFQAFFDADEVLPSLPIAMGHLRAFQDVAQAHNGSRSMLTGYDASVAYVLEQLSDTDDLFTVSTQEFSLSVFELVGTPTVVQSDFTGSESNALVLGVDFDVLTYSTSVTADGLPMQVVTGDGCNAMDYPVTLVPTVALIRRGGCTYATKAILARDAGYTVAAVYNNVPGLVKGTLSDSRDMPVISLSDTCGKELLANPLARLSFNITTNIFPAKTRNVIADWSSGSAVHTIVVGAHLDSVDAGAGINDNGSGSALVLTLLQHFQSIGFKPKNRLRFAWWAAEELGLKGSTHYVEDLKARGDTSHIALYLNFDMVASPNFVRGLFDASAAPDDVRQGVAALQAIIEEHMTDAELTFERLEFNGRSDYAPFVSAGIPANGLETGAEGVKTEEQRSKFGGLANVAYDTCYHASCDTYENINTQVFEENLTIAARVIRELAMLDNLRGFLAAGADAVEQDH